MKPWKYYAGIQLSWLLTVAIGIALAMNGYPWTGGCISIFIGTFLAAIYLSDVP